MWLVVSFISALLIASLFCLMICGVPVSLDYINDRLKKMGLTEEISSNVTVFIFLFILFFLLVSAAQLV